jgi:hypothetical protein
MRMQLQKELIEKIDWDVMIVLDACRYDTFEDVVGDVDILGNYMKVDSQAHHTAMWYDKNWPIENKNVNLISGHGILWLKDFRIFERFANPYGFFGENRKMWIYPGVNFEKLLEYQTKYPTMRHLVHIIPPHLPFLGKKGRAFMKSLDVINPHTTEGHGNAKAYDKVTEYGKEHGWHDPKECYRENLKFAMGWIEKFIDRIVGKVVVTADHGELLGEGDIYGHVEGFEDVLRVVPWFEVRR